MVKKAMCGRFEQSGTERYYADALGADTSDHLKWMGDHIPSYNTAPCQCPWMIMLNKGQLEFIGMTWGYPNPG
jgi:putative SOS response-associated peptidase YedK